MIGQLLAGRYQVLKVLGAGGFGQTYITADLHLPGQPQCVLKHLKPASASPEVLEIARNLFHKEAETLQKLGSHDRIPRLLAFFEENQEFYLVQEYVVGHTLTYELSSNQKWSEMGVQRLLREVLSILDFVHSQGVIHRDVKPDNIMRRDADGKLVLIDFGAIKQVRNQQFTGLGEMTKTVAIGTPGYMPLEQAGGTPRPSSDLYALGIICLQALTGLYPTEIQENDATGELQWQHLVTVSPQLVAFLTKMTRYHFKDRYGTAQEALQALQQLDNGAIGVPLSSAWGSPPANVPASTAATWVVAPPATTSGSLQTPVYQHPAVADPLLEPKPGGLVGRVLLGAALLLGSAGLGYLWVRPQLSAAQFETLLQTDRCRMAAPRQNKFTKVRALPDRAATVKTEIKAGEKLLFIARKQEFVQVEQRNGQTGWVFNDQIDGCGGAIVPATPTPTPTPPIKKPVVVKPTPRSPLPTASSPGSSIAPSITSSPSPPNSSASPSINPSRSPSAPLPTSSISPQPTPTQFTPAPSVSGSTTPPESSSPTPSPSNS